MENDRKALLLGVVIFGCLSVYRIYNYWTTGFFVSDEYGYFYNAVHGTVYAGRWFFGWLNILLFRLFGISSVDSFSFFLPWYIFFWGTASLFLFYGIMKELRFAPRVRMISLLSSFILIAFVLLSLGFLTEIVGLTTALLGIYFLTKYNNTTAGNRLWSYPLLASLSFGAAVGTREPYEAILVGCIFLVPLLAYSKRKEASLPRYSNKWIIVILTAAAFVLPAVIFLTVVSNSFSQQIVPLSYNIGQTLLTNPTTIATPTTTTTTGVPPTQTPVYAKYYITNTVVIFLGGILLGWGPVAFAIGLLGLLLLLRRSILKKDPTAGFLAALCTFSLGSYFVVSYIFSSDPTYFSFSNYSTILRFSDTALPAYFLTAPLALAVIAKSRMRLIGLVSIFLIFLLMAVPVYQTYAASNIQYVSENPFQLDFRTQAVQVRNYVVSNASGQPFILIGVPYGWIFTPGVEDLHSVQAYSLIKIPTLPSLTSENFTSRHWSTLYLFVDSPSRFKTIPALQAIANGSAIPGTSAHLPFKVISIQRPLQNRGFVLLKVHLEWSSA